jgi:hypothetical protein
MISVSMLRLQYRNSSCQEGSSSIVVGNTARNTGRYELGGGPDAQFEEGNQSYEFVLYSTRVQSTCINLRGLYLGNFPFFLFFPFVTVTSYYTFITTVSRCFGDDPHSNISFATRVVPLLSTILGAAVTYQCDHPTAIRAVEDRFDICAIGIGKTEFEYVEVVLRMFRNTQTRAFFW